MASVAKSRIARVARLERATLLHFHVDVHEHILAFVQAYPIPKKYFRANMLWNVKSPAVSKKAAQESRGFDSVLAFTTRASIENRDLRHTLRERERERGRALCSG